MSRFSNKLSAGIKTLIIVALSASAVLLLAFGPRAGEELPRDCVIVDYWEKWNQAFTEFGREETPGLQEISRLGREIAKEKLQGFKGLEEWIDRNGLVHISCGSNYWN